MSFELNQKDLHPDSKKIGDGIFDFYKSLRLCLTFAEFNLVKSFACL